MPPLSVAWETLAQRHGYDGGSHGRGLAALSRSLRGSGRIAAARLACPRALVADTRDQGRRGRLIGVPREARIVHG